MAEPLIKTSDPIPHPQILPSEAPFRLGMPHLDAGGVSTTWLMKEAGHLHWLAVADALGLEPTQWVDSQGRRCFASVVAATVTGDLTAFEEDTICQFRMVNRPVAGNRWLSQTDLEALGGKRICIEIMTSFATLDGPSNTQLVKAEMPGRVTTDQALPNARRAQILHNLGKVERARALEVQVPPHLSIPISRTEHLNGVGLVYFAQFQTFFAAAEENAIPLMPHGFQLVARRVHYYGNLDPGDVLDTVTEITANAHNLSSWLLAFTHARRKSDGRVIAACESSYRVL